MFKLENARATYQRLVNKVFEEQVEKNVEVYVDDMLVKSIEAEKHINDLEETLCTLNRFRMKLNPAKCAFGVSVGKFLGFMIFHREIEANPEKVEAILSMKPPQTTKEVQRLARRVAALNRFISRSMDKCFYFFCLLKKGFKWMDEADRSFQDLKRHLVCLLTLGRTTQGEDLYLYLAVLEVAISSVLV